ncbi:hypothetical protein ABDK00_014240 [Niabella insulamsoli]|uniref:hypothetical protein n=1 Tax=Niabella insulamsoli TaxID=3144874 RepID=UPI0031FBA5D3
MTKSQVIKEINSMEAFAYAMIEKAERLRLALGVSTPGGFKKVKKEGELSDEQAAKIIGRRKKYLQKKAAGSQLHTANS